LAEGEKKKGIIYDIKLREGEKLYAKEVREKKERGWEKGRILPSAECSIQLSVQGRRHMGEGQSRAYKNRH
jgi:hypothetical protein